MDVGGVPRRTGSSVDRRAWEGGSAHGLLSGYHTGHPPSPMPLPLRRPPTRKMCMTRAQYREARFDFRECMGAWEPCICVFAIGCFPIWVVVILVSIALNWLVRGLQWIAWALWQCTCCWRGRCFAPTPQSDWDWLAWAIDNNTPATIHAVNERARAPTHPPLPASEIARRFRDLLQLPEQDAVYYRRYNRAAVRRRVIPVVLQHPLLAEPGVVHGVGFDLVLDAACPAAWDRLASIGACVNTLEEVRECGR